MHVGGRMSGLSKAVHTPTTTFCSAVTVQLLTWPEGAARSAHCQDLFSTAAVDSSSDS